VINTVIDWIGPVWLEERIEAVAVREVYLSGADRSHTGIKLAYVRDSSCQKVLTQDCK
jgi:hypothetical protein